MSTKELLWDYAKAVIAALAAAFIFRATVVGAFEIPSGSMIPTLQIGDRLLVDKLTYRFRKPERFEIIVFEDPARADRDLIKRIIALPGETLEIRNRVVYINGTPLADAMYAHHTDPLWDRIPMRDDYGPVTVPPGSYFMMGDNRENSADSRVWGFLERDRIIGHAFILYWSRNTDMAFPAEIRWDRFGKLLG